MSKQFLKIIEKHINPQSSVTILDFFGNTEAVKTAFNQIDSKLADNYLYNYFILWLSYYVQKNRQCLQDYYSDKQDLAFICSNFINFCFKNKIILNAERTLQSFAAHNQLSDDAVKKELVPMVTKSNVNLLGFGLDEGSYEKELAQYLTMQGVSKVTLYGMDPYAKKSTGIHYLTPCQLSVEPKLRFDLIIARWSLHHVALRSRWTDLSQCIKRCSSDARILFIEHGFLEESVSPLERKLYIFLNATFDIIANIGLRPRYFTETAPHLGKNFFIRYLDFNDFNKISNSARQIKSQKIYDVGPVFPNQTIFCYHL